MLVMPARWESAWGPMHRIKHRCVHCVRVAVARAPVPNGGGHGDHHHLALQCDLIYTFFHPLPRDEKAAGTNPTPKPAGRGAGGTAGSWLEPRGAMVGGSCPTCASPLQMPRGLGPWGRSVER